MATDLGLVMHTAQRNAHKLSVGGSGDGHGDAGLARARRPHKADKPALDVRRKLSDSQIFDDALLDLFKAVVILVQHFSGLCNVQCFLRTLVPRQGQTHVQIVAYNGSLRRAEGLLGKTGDLFEKLCFDLLVGNIKSADFFAVLAHIVAGVFPVPQLLLDDLHFLPEIVLPLVFAHLIVGGFCKLLLDGENVQLVVEHFGQHGKSAGRPGLLQKKLLILILKAHSVGDKIRHISGVGTGKYAEHYLGRRVVA